MKKTPGTQCLVVGALLLGLSPAAFATPAAESFVRGDVEQDGIVNLTDAVRVLRYLFRGDPEPPCLEAADADDNGSIDLADGVHLLGFLFRGDSSLPGPYPLCGPDPREDGLPCTAFASCALPATVTISGRALREDRYPVSWVQVSVGSVTAIAHQSAFVLPDVPAAPVLIVDLSSWGGGFTRRIEVLVPQGSDPEIDLGAVDLYPWGVPPDERVHVVSGFDTCGSEYPFYTHTYPRSSETELHVIGIYESGGGDIRVLVDRPGSMVLALSAYSNDCHTLRGPIHWKVEAGAHTVIEKVIVNGYDIRPQASVPAGVPLEIHGRADVNTYGYGEDSGGGNTPAMIRAFEDATGLKARSFHGRYCSDSFVFVR